MNQATSTFASAHPAERLARDFAQIIHTGDRVAARAYFEQHFAPDLLKIPMDHLLGIVSNLHDQTRGVAIGDVLQTTATSVSLALRGELTGVAQALVVSVEADPPYRVTGIFIQPAPQPVPLIPADAAGLPVEL